MDRSRSLRGYNQPNLRADDVALNEIMGLIEKAERPVLYCGGGIITSGAAEELKKFAEATQHPRDHHAHGHAAGFPETHPLSLRWLGMHGAAFANWAVNGEYKQRKNPDEPMVKLKDGADLLLAFGVRFDDRVTGKFEEFCKHGHDCSRRHRRLRDQQESQACNLAVVGDIKDTLSRLNAMIAKAADYQRSTPPGTSKSTSGKKKAPFAYRDHEEIANSDHMKDHLGGNEDQVILPANGDRDAL